MPNGIRPSAQNINLQHLQPEAGIPIDPVLVKDQDHKVGIVVKEPSSEGSTLLTPKLKPGDIVVLENLPCEVNEDEVEDPTMDQEVHALYLKEWLKTPHPDPSL